ncbi:BamA/TamA family outer membrane protein [Myxococcaceae bacterium GXIMD 01537]
MSHALLPLLLAPLLLASPDTGEAAEAGDAADVAEAAAGYEAALVAWGLAQHDRQPEAAPEGKRLEEVLVAAEDVVAPSDPYPLLLNMVHARTREDVIRREVLLEAGSTYSAALVEETARNLRKLGIFAVVRMVPVQGREPDGVALLVVTKDLWSLRLNQDFAAVGSLLQYLRLQGTEQNFLGRNKKVAADFTLRLDTVSLGQSYIDRRLGGSRWYFGESAGLILGRESGKPEGSYGSVVLQRPLFSLATPWSLTTQAAWNVRTSRIFRGAEVWQLPYPDGAPVPYIYDTREVSGSALYVRSFGTRFKWEAGGGVGLYLRGYAAPPDSGLDEGQREWLKRVHLPRSEDALYGTLTLRAFEPRYEVLHGVNSFALSEDFQMGHSVAATLRYAPPVFASAAHFLELGVAARQRWHLGDSLTTVSAAGAIRRALDGGGGWTNRHWALEVEQVSPRLLGGRFVARGLLDVNIDDLFDRVSLLGGGNGLRGARPDAYSGKRLVLLNVEYRTAPLVVRTLHLGGVLFWDAGRAFDEGPQLVHSVGVGVRLLLPQFNTFPFRLDFGYVLNGDRPPVGGRFSLASGQVTEYRPGFLDSPLY